MANLKQIIIHWYPFLKWLCALVFYVTTSITPNSAWDTQIQSQQNWSATNLCLEKHYLIVASISHSQTRSHLYMCPLRTMDCIFKQTYRVHRVIFPGKHHLMAHIWHAVSPDCAFHAASIWGDYGLVCIIYQFPHYKVTDNNLRWRCMCSGENICKMLCTVLEWDI